MINALLVILLEPGGRIEPETEPETGMIGRGGLIRFLGAAVNCEGFEISGWLAPYRALDELSNG